MSRDDDEGYPPEGGCIGSGAVHDLAPSGRSKKHPKRAIGFVIFPDKQPRKPKRRPVKAKRRKR